VVSGSSFEGVFPEIMEKLSLFERFYTFVNGVFDVTSLVYFVTVICVFLFLSVQSMEKRRWSE
jgi:ABC-2 type transport system permease protein